MQAFRRIAGWSTLACCFLVGTIGPGPSGQGTLGELLQQLQRPATSDRAAKKLLAMGKSNPEALAYLVRRLPGIIGKGPSQGRCWTNAVGLAGALKMAQASPALAEWIGARMGNGTTTLAQTARLEDQPAARALVDIGDPAVPSIARALQGGNLQQRWAAAFALEIVHSKAASKALEVHLRHESDRSLVEFLESALDSWRAPPAHP